MATDTTASHDLGYQTNYQAAGGFPVTPHDTNDFSTYAQGLYVGGAGNVHVQLANGNELTFIGVAAGTFMPLIVKRVYSTSTTATNIIGLL